MIKKIKGFVLGSLAALILKIIHSTISWKVVGDLTTVRNLKMENESIVIVFWHGRQFMLPWLYTRYLKTKKNNRLNILTSQHIDGRIIANAVGYFGIASLQGSSTRGAKRAALALMHKLKKGQDVAITPDGPKGPIHQVKAGVVRIASATGARMLPVSYAVKDFWQINSWDKMILPKPFTKGVYFVGDPISVKEGSSIRDCKILEIELKQALDEQLNQAINYSYE